MDDHIDFVTRQLEAADSLSGLLATSFIGLEMVERGTLLLTEIAPLQTRPAYVTAYNEATHASGALLEAPTLIWPSRAAFASDRHRELAATVADLSLTVSRALLNAVNLAADPADRVACLGAVRHTGLVYAALRQVP
ncbi:hypothetical protein GCM10009678_66420 [Actinomadura kijaniata]|uniref:Uncharacterized protein n=1 Tax=Actinomadura namibiensis TaxID=182080 RepID=A0A7W3LYF1_ACTNM|nr:hypothetical protein [Actinomadura namibiensis]MBA8956544.1 hypothetical protein [Actinomadura namibiensis]